MERSAKSDNCDKSIVAQFGVAVRTVYVMMQFETVGYKNIAAQ